MGRYRAMLTFSPDDVPDTIYLGQVYNIPDDRLHAWQAEIDAGWMVPVASDPAVEVPGIGTVTPADDTPDA